MYLNDPRELVPRHHEATVNFGGSRPAETGISTKSLPSKRSADPKKTPGIQPGSLSSAAAVLPSWPLLPCPDQSRTVWPEPSFIGHQPTSGKPLAPAAAGRTAIEAVARPATASKRIRTRMVAIP